MSEQRTADPVLLIENAAGASQERRLLREGDLYEPVYMNVYKPLAGEIDELRSALRAMLEDFRTDGCASPGCTICKRSHAVEKRVRKLVYGK